MPLPLSSIAIAEKNKLATDSIFMLALMVIVPGVVDPIRIVLNNSDITWAGDTWTAFPFEIADLSDNNKGEVPQIVVKIANVSRAMEGFIQDYDSYVKTNGYEPMGVYIYVLNSKNLASSTPEVEHYFELTKPSFDAKWAYFTLGAGNPFNRRFPGNRIMKSHCVYRRFKGDRCGYTGSETTCDRTLTQCRAFNNQARFGGAPGLGRSGITLEEN